MRRLRMTIGLLSFVLVVSLMPLASVRADALAGSTTTLSGSPSVEEGNTVVLTAAVDAPDGYDADATITFSPVGGGGPDCADVAVATAGTECDLGALAEGSYTYHATYSGNATTETSTSPDFSFDVTAAAPPPPPDPATSVTALDPQAPVEEGTTIVLTARVDAPDGYDIDATITFHAIGGGGTDCTDVPVDTAGTTCSLDGLSVGTHVWEATYTGNGTTDGSTSDPISFEVTATPPPPPGLDASTTALTGPGSIVVGAEAVLTATVDAPAGYDIGATVTFHAISGGGPDCADVPVDTSGTECHLDGLPIGTYVYEATYSGNGTTETSTSDPVTFHVTAVPDTTLDASGVTIDVTTFYPVKDSYRDSVKIKGVRNEPISVTIRVYKPSGSRILTKVLALGSGAYSYAWSGRDSHGKVRASGKYKIIQSLRDGAGHTLVVTKYVHLSHKKLVKKTAYITKKGLSITAGSSGNIFVSKRLGYAKLLGSSGSPAMAGYSFTIPKATVYSSITFQVYATGPTSSPRTQIGLQNMSWCPDLSGDWNIGCFDHWKSWSGTKVAWHSAPGSPSLDRKATRVRGAIYASHGTVTVRKVRMKVVYKVLR